MLQRTQGPTHQVANYKGNHTFDGADHGPIASPFLCICQVGDSIQVCGNEEAARVLPDAKASVLNLVVVYVLVKAHDNGAHLQAHALPFPG